MRIDVERAVAALGNHTERVAWSVSLDDYHRWSDSDQQATHALVEAHGIDRHNVPVGHGNELEVVIRRDGALLRTWVYDRDEHGRVRVCRSCAACPVMLRAVMPLVTDLPDLPGALLHGWYDIATEPEATG